MLEVPLLRGSEVEEEKRPASGWASEGLYGRGTFAVQDAAGQITRVRAPGSDLGNWVPITMLMCL